MAKRIVKPVVPDLFLRLLKAEFKGVEVVKEFRFHETRKWRFDYAFPSHKIAIEVDGGCGQVEGISIHKVTLMTWRS